MLSVIKLGNCQSHGNLQLYCTVGYAPSIENMIQMLGGALVPGKPVANMYFTWFVRICLETR